MEKLLVPGIKLPTGIHCEKKTTEHTTPKIKLKI